MKVVADVTHFSVCKYVCVGISQSNDEKYIFCTNTVHSSGGQYSFNAATNVSC